MSEIKQIGTTFHCYLIIGKEGCVLVDTGLLPARDAIYAEIKKYNVRLIVLTHGHIDHIANAAYFSEKLSAPIAMHQSDYELIRNPSARPLVSDNIIGKTLIAMSGLMSKSSPVEPFEPSIFLKQGMSLSQYGIDGEIVELPGHTAGSIGIIVNGNTLIAGDAMMNMMSSTKPKLFEDKIKMMESFERIQKMPVSQIYMGHGKKIDKK